MNACHRSTIFVVHFIVVGAAVLVAKLGTRRSALLYKGEWAYCMRSKAFKDKARLRLHSKAFSLKNFIILLKVLYKAENLKLDELLRVP